MSPARWWSSLLPVLAALAIGACSMGPSGPVDGPGVRIDPDSIPPAVPRAEPRSAYGNPPSYEVLGRRYRVRDSAAGYDEKGTASWYGSKFHGRRTSSGEPYDMYRMTAAHRTLPLPTYARVTHLDNGRSVVVRINDRGPFHDDRLIDLSYAAATQLGVVDTGTAPVRVQVIEPGADANAAEDTGGAPAPGPRFIQVGAFTHFANAQQMRARVQGADIRGVEVERGRTAAGERVYRVRIGPLDDHDEREAVLGKLDRAGIGAVSVGDE